MGRIFRWAFLLVFGTLLLAGCDVSQRLDSLEKQNKELQGQLDRERRVSDYDLQAKCAKEAKQWFNENESADKNTLLLTYSDHYNHSLNKCFILVEYHFNLAISGWANSMDLWDVQENSDYGAFYQSHFGTTDNKPSTCKVLNKSCSTVEGFNSLVSGYMNN